MTDTTLHIIPLIIFAFTFFGFCKAIFSYSHLKRSLLTLKTKENIKIWMSRESSNHLSCLGEIQEQQQEDSIMFNGKWLSELIKTSPKTSTYLDHTPLSSSRQQNSSDGKSRGETFQILRMNYLSSCYQFIFTWNNAWLIAFVCGNRAACEQVCWLISTASPAR